ncbi:conserved hypothetical protein [Xenorhabdus nematophila F1]|uniref:DUF5983 family protein n=1 Tax=Xenorhabdus nematophila TaxID=628 RepID=UPI0003275D56|nr:DUF5983 family protein [Xenorhabdus nematophila]CCW29764.1 conserved hypothetical protein [Xenorhabdus nematophila F1]CEE91194.1 conserved hypothetical protein [Xenorhabdus nematophila str. Anatoliense]
MKIGLNLNADSISVLALNMGKIGVEVDGIDIAELMDAVNTQGLSLRIAEEPGKMVVENPLPAGSRLTGVCCSTAHITSGDNELLYTLSHVAQEYGDAEWIHFTGSGYLIRLDAWSFPLLRLKRLGLSKACRRLVATLISRNDIGLILLDAFGELLPGFDTFEW